MITVTESYIMRPTTLHTENYNGTLHLSLVNFYHPNLLSFVDNI